MNGANKPPDLVALTAEGRKFGVEGYTKGYSNNGINLKRRVNTQINEEEKDI